VEAAFLPALLLLILGSGCLKGNIATQVGALYAPADRRRDRAYLLFNLGINLGAFAGPLVCGLLGEQGNWHIGFAMAGVGMLVGLVIYVTGWRNLPLDRHDQPSAETPPPIRPPHRRAAGAGGAQRLLQHSGGSGLQRFPCGSMLPPTAIWAASPSRSRGIWPDGLVTVLASPLVVMLWKRQTQRGTLPPVALRIGMGCAAMAAADAAGDPCSWPLPHSLGPLVGYAYFLLASSAYLYVMPVLLAAVAGAAPPRLTATMMGRPMPGCSLPISPAAGWRAFTNPGARNASGPFMPRLPLPASSWHVARRPLAPDERA
jgi:POT family proton-dependent oligopeptide transporter